MKTKVFVIGAGGGGCRIVPELCLLIGAENVVVVDGDTVEEKNLDRQHFTQSDIGQNKAIALSVRYGCDYLAEWFAFGARSYGKEDFLISCLDNHPGRIAILETCDFEGCRGIIAGNETNSSSAQFYTPSWKGTRLDPRVQFPELLTDTSGDPRRGAIGCTGPAQEAKPQLGTSNLMAISLALHLYVLWVIELPKLGKSVIPKLPHLLAANMTRLETHVVGELTKTT